MNTKVNTSISSSDNNRIKIKLSEKNDSPRIKLSLYEKLNDGTCKRIYSKAEIEKKTQKAELRERIVEWFDTNDGMTNLTDNDTESFNDEEPIITGMSIETLDEGDDEGVVILRAEDEEPVSNKDGEIYDTKYWDSEEVDESYDYSTIAKREGEEVDESYDYSTIANPTEENMTYNNFTENNLTEKNNVSHKPVVVSDNSSDLDLGENFSILEPKNLQKPVNEEFSYCNWFGRKVVQLASTAGTIALYGICNYHLVGNSKVDNSSGAANVLIGLADLTYKAYLGWNYVGPWLSNGMGFSERTVVERTEVEKEEPGFVRRTLSKLNNLPLGMFAGQVAAISIILFTAVVASILDALIIHSDPSHIEEEAVKAFMKNVAFVGQFWGALYTFCYDIPVVGYSNDAEEGIQNVA